MYVCTVQPGMLCASTHSFLFPPPLPLSLPPSFLCLSPFLPLYLPPIFPSFCCLTVPPYMSTHYTDVCISSKYNKIIIQTCKCTCSVFVYDDYTSWGFQEGTSIELGLHAQCMGIPYQPPRKSCRSSHTVTHTHTLSLSFSLSLQFQGKP